MHFLLKNTLAIAALAISAQAAAQVVFYEHSNFEGRSFSTQKKVANFDRYGFNDRASSVIVLADRWEVCDASKFRGRCIVLGRGRYPSLSAMRLNDRVSSARSVSARGRIDEDRYAPPPIPVYDNHRRGNERLYEANVTSARAVFTRDDRRCWTEREQVGGNRQGHNVGGAVVGALLGGIIGHQIGGGTGKDIATAGGAIAGGVVGYNTGGKRSDGYTQDVERCSDDATGSSDRSRPDYWDVTYNFRGVEHRIQTTYQPGNTISVNRDGEPRAG
jgi:uncharacterized protein YcfJ